MKRILGLVSTVVVIAVLALTATSVFAGDPFLSRFPNNTKIASTVPANGDQNPYGVALVPRTTGKLVRGDVLVSNFNNSKNLQGTGTTIVEVSPTGSVRLFAQLEANKLPGACPGGLGLTTALVATHAGWVIVGSLPTSDGKPATAKAGCLIVLNSMGQAVETIEGNLVNGPWDMTKVETHSRVTLFVTNVLNGTVAGNGKVVNQGNVVRIVLGLDGSRPPRVESRTVIASGFGEKTDPEALVIGPTGLGFRRGVLYVADTLSDRIAAIPDALTRRTSAGAGRTVSSGGGLKGPLGLAIAKGGDILTVNGGDGNIVEVTPGGAQVVVRDIDLTKTGGGTLFGLALALHKKGVFYVNDGDNTLDLLH